MARLTLCLTLAFIVSCAAPGERPGDVQASTEAIRLQIGKYTAALDAADTSLASQVWLTSPEVSLIHPGGHQHGWEEVKDFYTFFGSSFSERKLTVRDISVHVNGSTAWAEFYWHFDAKQRSNGSPIQTDGRETQVYRKVGDHWLLVHVHYSGALMSPKPSSLSFWSRSTAQCLPSRSQVPDCRLADARSRSFEKDLGWAPSLDGRASFARTPLA